MKKLDQKNTVKIGVVILNWNGEKDTLECLDSVKKSISKNFKIQVYVVDNYSQKDPIPTFKELFPENIYIRTSKNLGFAGGNNIGIKQALNDEAEWVILLNNDTKVSSDTFENLVSGAIKHSFDLAAPKIYFYPGNEFHKDAYSKDEQGKVIWYAGGRIDWNNVIPSHIGVDEVDHGQWEKASATDFATGCCLLINKKVISQIGYLDDSNKAYFEDTDYCIRAFKNGFKIGYIPSSKMWHKNAGSTGGSGSSAQSNLVNKSRFGFAMRHAPLRAKLAVIKNRLLNRPY